MLLGDGGKGEDRPLNIRQEEQQGRREWTCLHIYHELGLGKCKESVSAVVTMGARPSPCDRSGVRRLSSAATRYVSHLL